jgi:hypothetical protein
MVYNVGINLMISFESCCKYAACESSVRSRLTEFLESVWHMSDGVETRSYPVNLDLLK